MKRWFDTEMVRDFPLAKTSPELVAKAILEGVEEGLEDIAPDAVGREMLPPPPTRQPC